MHIWTTRFQTLRPLAALPPLRQASSEKILSTSYEFHGKNRQRERHSIFKYTLEGEGAFGDSEGEHRVGKGRGFLTRIADPETSYYYPKDGTRPWTFVYVAFSGGFRAHVRHAKPGGGTTCPPLGPVPVADFRDGTSNTLLIGECSDWLVDPATGEKVDHRPDCNHGFLMGNACDRRGRMFNLTVIAHRINEQSALAYGAMGNCGPNQPLRSPHAGGVDVVMADGATRFLSEGIEFEVLCNLANREDGNAISASDF